MEYGNNSSSESSPKLGWGIFDSQTDGSCNNNHTTMINLRLGSRPSSAGEGSPPAISISPAKNYKEEGSPSKRSRASYQNMQNPCCQVEGCNLSLTAAKDYHRRHRICEAHSKSPRVVVGGLVRRFCQQCSRFHDLSEFDDKKRSCRKRLSDHNARRRRLPPEPLHRHQLSSPSSSLPSAIYDQRSSHNISLNGLPSSLSPSSEWQENANRGYYMPRQPRESSSLIGPGLDEPACFLTNEIPPTIGSGERFCPHQSMQYIADARTDSHSTEPGGGVLSVRSLLSSNPWYLDGSSSSVMNENGSSSTEAKRWSNNNGAVMAAADESLMPHGGGGASSSSSVQENGGCFLFQPKGFF